jgi:general secretion pathway protein J
MRMAGSRRGVTLIEVLIAVSLLALLSVAMLTAMRVGLSAIGKADAKLMENRRVAGAQRIIEQELEGFMPTIAVCGSEAGGGRTGVPFFQGEPTAMRFVSTFSLQQGWRGRPQILELTVIPGDQGRGVRLIVNEIPYSPDTSGMLCTGRVTDPETHVSLPRFRPIEAGPNSFVLADKLEFCRFVFLQPALPPALRETWRPKWVLPRWPLAVRIEMAPLAVDASRMQPVTVTAPLHVTRSPEIDYVD